MGMKVINRVQQGDIIYASCVGHTLCHHIGIVYKKDDKIKIFHNSPYIKNKFGGQNQLQSTLSILKSFCYLHYGRKQKKDNKS